MRSYSDPRVQRVNHLERTARAARLRGDLAGAAIAEGRAAAEYARLVDDELRAKSRQEAEPWHR